MIKKNMLANLIGKLYTAGISFIVLPIYLKHLGAESYGLVGIFGMIQVFALLLDSGITPMVTREIARMKDKIDASLHLKNLVKTTEILLLFAGVLSLAIVFISASFIATKWLNANTLSSEIVTNTIILIGGIVAFRFNVGLYGGILMALEKHISYNIALSVIATFKSLGAIYVLIYVSNDIITFFKFQILISIIEFIIYRLMVAKYMPLSLENASFSLGVYKDNLNFIGGYGFSMILIFILSQSGNIVLSKILPLNEFGYYTFAIAIASVLQMTGGPLFQVISPRLISTYANDRENLANFYHKACQSVAFLAIPASLVLSIFSHEIILLWTQNQETTDNIHLIVSLLALGTLLNLLATMPGQLQIADGRMKKTVYINTFSILFVLPMNIVFGQMYGGAGIAGVWIALNILYVLTGIFLIHPQLLNENKTKWIWEDILKPFLLVGLFVGISKYCYMFFELHDIFLQLSYIGLVFLMSYIVNMYVLSIVKQDIMQLFLKKVKNVKSNS